MFQVCRAVERFPAIPGAITILSLRLCPVPNARRAVELDLPEAFVLCNDFQDWAGHGIPRKEEVFVLVNQEGQGGVERSKVPVVG